VFLEFVSIIVLASRIVFGRGMAVAMPSKPGKRGFSS
jgi:hypothetical protein